METICNNREGWYGFPIFEKLLLHGSYDWSERSVGVFEN
jgi:hypothetical protein